MMFTTKPKLRYCPDCNSPNPTDRDTCFYCHTALGRLDTETIRQVSPHRADTPYPALPSGWQAQAQPSGEVIVTPAFTNRWRTPIGKAVGIAALMMVGILVGYLSPHSARPNNPSGLPVLYFLMTLCGIVAVIGGIALLIKREEIRVGQGWLVWKEIWGGYVIERAVTQGGGLRIATSEQHSAKGGRWWERALIAENLTDRATLMGMTRHAALFSFGDHPSFVGDDIARVGAYLASVTGWHLIDPENGAY